MINQSLQIQLQNPTKNGWGSEVSKDIIELNIGVEIEDIKNMSKTTFKELVRTKVIEKAFKYLMNKNKSKTKDLPHSDLEANRGEIFIDDKQFIFKCRSRMIK